MMNQKTAIKSGVLVSTLVLLAACAGPAQTTLADGSVAYEIECDGSTAGLTRCFERAGKSCGAQGYMLVTPDGRLISSGEADSSSLTKIYEDEMNRILFKCGS